MNVYQVEVATGQSGFRLEHHVRALDAAEARAKVQHIRGPGAVLLGVTFRRACKPHEIAEELAKPPVTGEPWKEPVYFQEHRP